MTVTDRNTKNEIMAEFERLKKEAGKNRITLPSNLKAINKNDTKADYLLALEELKDLLENGMQEETSAKEDHGLDRQISIFDDSGNSTKSNVIKEEKRPQKINSHGDEVEQVTMEMLNPEVIDKLGALNAVKQARKDEYQNLLDIEQELDALAKMVNQRKREYLTKQNDRAEELRDVKLKSDEEMTQLQDVSRQKIAEAERRLADKKTEIAEAIERRDATRTEEVERYEYDLSVKHKIEDDAWEDDSAARESKITAIEAESASRQEILKEQEAKVTELEAKMDELPKLLDEARAEGEREREAELNEEHLHQEALFKKDSEATIKALEQKIASLKEDYEILLAEKDTLQAKLDKAYEDSNKLYLQTVQSTGGIKILGGGE